MTREEYKKILNLCPPHNSNEFIDFLRDNNKVVTENNDWIMIENIKYNDTNNKHYTAFLKPSSRYHQLNVNLVMPSEWSSLWRIYQRFCDGWEIKIKRKVDRSVKRFHVHFIE